MKKKTSTKRTKAAKRGAQEPPGAALTPLLAAALIAQALARP
jgi:hypothetical protein